MHFEQKYINEKSLLILIVQHCTTVACCNVGLDDILYIHRLSVFYLKGHQVAIMGA